MGTAVRPKRPKNRSGIPAEGIAPTALSGAVLAAATLAITVGVYLRSLGNSFVYDDRNMITMNRFIGQWSYFWRAFGNDLFWFKDPSHLPASSYYRPLQNVWLAANFHLFGFEPAAWHATSIALHLLATGLVFMMAARVTGDRIASCFAAILFGLMPAHAEAVLWLSAISIPLAATFELAALIMFMNRAQAQRRNWALALISYAGALISHESAVAFPTLVAFYAYLFEPDSLAKRADHRERGRRLYRALLSAAPFALAAFAYLVVRVSVLGFLFGRPGVVRYATGAQALMTVPRALLAYLLVLATPWMAGPAHPIAVVRSAGEPGFMASVALLLSMGAATWAAVRNSSRRRLYLFCIAWIAVTIAPALNVIAFQQRFVQDRYLYLPSVGWCVMIGDLAGGLASGAIVARPIAWGAMAAMAGLYTITLWNVQGFWRDETALYTRCIEMSPQCAECHALLGLVLYGRGDLAGAEPELSKAISLEPALGADDSDSLYALGLIHAQSGHADQAAAELDRALKLTAHPDPENYIVPALLHDARGEAARSEALVREAASLPGGAPAAGVARAMIRLNRGDVAGTEAILRELVQRFPGDAFVWNSLGKVRLGENQQEQALAAFRQAERLSPGDSRLHFSIAQTLHGLSRDQEALDECRQALSLQGDYPDASALIADIQRSRGN